MAVTPIRDRTTARRSSFAAAARSPRTRRSGQANALGSTERAPPGDPRTSGMITAAASETTGSSRRRGPSGGGGTRSPERTYWVHNPQNLCRRNHSDTLAKLIRRHDASATVLREPLRRTSQAPDQGFRENVRVGGGTLTPILLVRTRSNPESPTSCGIREAVGRPQTVMPCSSSPATVPRRPM